MKALKCLQDLDNDEYIRTIKCSLTSQALRVASAIDEEEYLSRRYGSRDYIEKLEKLFISSQQNRSFRLDFANIKQGKQETILQFYSNLLYLAKSAKITNVNHSTACKDRFVDGIKSTYIKRKLLEDESDDQTLNDLMTKAVNLESIEKNLPKQHPTTSSTLQSGQAEPMEIGSISPYQQRDFRQETRQPNAYPFPRRPWYNQPRPPPRPQMQTSRGYDHATPFFQQRRPWYNQTRTPPRPPTFNRYYNNPYGTFATTQQNFNRPRTSTGGGGRQPPLRAAIQNNTNGRTYHPNKWKDKREDGRRVQYAIQHIEGTDRDIEQDNEATTNAPQYDDEIEQSYNDQDFYDPYNDPYNPDHAEGEYLESFDQSYEPHNQQEQHFL